MQQETKLTCSACRQLVF